jgi:hypothetical protein
MTVIKGSDGSGSMIDPGIYRARLAKIEDAVSEEYGPQLKFFFKVLDADGDETQQEILGWASQKFHPRSKLFAWAKAMLRSKCPTPPDDIDTDVLIGKRADVEVVAYKKQDGSDGTKIGALFPYATMTSQEDAA